MTSYHSPKKSHNPPKRLLFDKYLAESGFYLQQNLLTTFLHRGVLTGGLASMVIDELQHEICPFCSISFYAIFIPSRHFVKAVSSQPDRGDLSAIDGAVEVIFFDFDGTLTESHRHDFCSVPGLSPNSWSLKKW